MKDCGYCPFDEPDCDTCKIPEFTDDMYRDTCDVCHEFMMIPYNTHDHFNLVVCKECAKKPAGSVFSDIDDAFVKTWAIETFEGIYVEGIRRWW